MSRALRRLPHCDSLDLTSPQFAAATFAPIYLFVGNINSSRSNRCSILRTWPLHVQETWKQPESRTRAACRGLLIETAGFKEKKRKKQQRWAHTANDNTSGYRWTNWARASPPPLSICLLSVRLLCNLAATTVAQWREAAVKRSRLPKTDATWKRGNGFLAVGDFMQIVTFRSCLTLRKKKKKGVDSCFSFMTFFFFGSRRCTSRCTHE